MTSEREECLEQLATDLGISSIEEIHATQNYALSILDKGILYISGQLPRAQGTIAVTGRVGLEASLEDAQRAARICTVRALIIIRQTIGSLDHIDRLLRMCVYVQSAPEFTQLSEVADAASSILYSVFGTAGGHTRTTVGVYHLPKNAAVEIDYTAAVKGDAPWTSSAGSR